MKRILFFILSIFFLYTSDIYSQCTNCDVTITGSTNINDQNNSMNYCITGSWTGTIMNIANNSTVCINSSAEWTMPGDLTLQQAIQVDNYGTISGAGHLLKIQGQTDLINHATGTIDVGDFENQDTEFINHGSLTAENIYLHGPTENSGTITSTADCGGAATTSCGFYVGNKNQAFNNSGTVNAVDATLADGVIGGGDFIVSGTLTFQSNNSETANNFYVNNLNLQASNTYNEGVFEVTGDFDCNNANVETTICLDGGNQTSNCSGGSDPIVECLTLPVDIISFDIKVVSEKYVYSWEVRSEVDVDRYEILQSNDGKTFSRIEEISATESNFYQYVGSKIQSEISYFKLQSVDFDGTVEVFEDIRVVKNSDLFSFDVRPNPVSKDETLYVQFENREDALVEIYNITGEKISSVFIKDENKIDLNLSKIQTSGLYLVKVSTNTSVYTKEIFVQ